MMITSQSDAVAFGPVAAPSVREQGQVWNKRMRRWLILLVVWGLGAFYAGAHLKRGWVPHDEGAFAQSAVRVLHGELPHRDYTELYTGGLAYLHAFAFRYLGENLATLRLVLFVFFLAWIPAVYWIASQLVADWVAGAITFLAVAWSLPNYSAAVPSWYNLFFATFGTAALFAYLRRPRWTWLFLAGLCGGLSFLAKTVALYYVAGVLLFFVFLEQSEARAKENAPNRSGRLYRAFIWVSLLAFLIELIHLVRQRTGIEELVGFVLPAAALVCLLLLREGHIRGRRDGDRFTVQLRMVAPFVFGFGVPVFLFLVPYLRAHAAGALFRGIFLLPFKRVSGAYMDLPRLETILPVVSVIGMLVLSGRLRGLARWILTLAAAAFSAYSLALSADSSASYVFSWHAACWVIPPMAVIGAVAIWLAKRRDSQPVGLEERRLFLLLSMASLCSLVQFPFAAPIYFCYVAPLAILAAAALLRKFPGIPRLLLAVLFAHFLLFVVFRVTSTFIYDMGRNYRPDSETHTLALPRAGNLRVDRDSADVYKRLVPLIQQHAGSGEIYAAPDCPQVYFLAGYNNATPTLFDFFDDPNGHTGRILRMIDNRPIRVMVLNNDPHFSGQMKDDLLEALEDRFPQTETVGDFEVRWRP